MQTISQQTNKRRSAVEREQFVTPDGTILTVAHFHAHIEEKAICLIPPLIGGSFILYGRQFATLMKQGVRVVSFNYRGHDQSGGRFALGSSFDDTHAIARRLRRERPDIPLVGVGMCSGSMPLFDILGREPDLFDRLIFINAIHRLQQTATPLEAARIYFRERGLRPPSSIRDLTHVVLTHIFPEIDQSPDRFGILPFDRVDLRRISGEYVFARRPGTRFVCDKPSLCIYGFGDELLDLARPSSEADYVQSFRRRFPNIRFESVRANHFMSGIREEVARSIHRFITAE